MPKDTNPIHSPPSAFDLMDFLDTHKPLGLQGDELRAKVADVVSRFNGFGVDDKPQGRQAAYGDLVAHGERENIRTALFSRSSGASSCGVLIRILWKLLGVDDKNLQPDYVFGSVFGTLQAIAGHHGALHMIGTAASITELLDPAVGPNRGDVIAISRTEPDPAHKDKNGNPGVKSLQHIFTVLERDGNVFFSQDGGQVAPASLKLNDSPCNGIYKRRRTLNPATQIFAEDAEARPVAWWVDITKIKFTKNAILPIRGEGIPDPDPS